MFTLSVSLTSFLKLNRLMTGQTRLHMRPARTQIRVFAVRVKRAWVLSYPLGVRGEL